VISSKEIMFLSTQLVPVEESEWVRKVLLPPFEKEKKIKVIFIGSEYGELADRLIAEYKAKRGKVDVVGGLHSDFSSLYHVFKDLKRELPEIEKLENRKFFPGFKEAGNIKGTQVYIPWLQGTYIFAVNKKTLDYLPENVDIWNLNYEDLLRWGKNIYQKTGQKKLGFPLGPRGLIHRFVHGYLYPSFTGYQIIKFNSESGYKMWEFVRNLWNYVNPSAPAWDAMDIPLLSEEVWIAWDHTARLKQAIMERPDDFLVIPSPAGPSGRGIITVLAGLGIPKTSRDTLSAFYLIEYLTRPDVQGEILKGTGFFPVLKGISFEGLKKPFKIIAEGVIKQSEKEDVVNCFIPAGLGKRQGEFSKIMRDVFIEIVVKKRNIKEVLERKDRELKNLFKETGAPLPYPDKVDLSNEKG
jgi:multiple sugar transport system substrate-binding protein